MREIKFRAWDYDDCKMYNVMSYSPITFGEIKPHVGIYPIGESKPVTVTQISTNFKLIEYTGLKDKDGREIFEGDVLRYLDSYNWSTEYGYDFEDFLNVGRIIYDDKLARFDITNKSDISYDDFIYEVENYEVIGNIYENKELLEESK